jgi:diguanylate cyclase (GGDEF)-like protein
MVDIDFFKKVNDEHGHAMGDEVICRVADVLRDHRGSTDIAGRYGGEEFCMAYLGVEITKAVEIAEKIRTTIAAPGFARIPVTVSIGVSSTEFGAKTPSALLEEADQSLYASKNNGRNRVTRFDEIDSLGSGPEA